MSETPMKKQALLIGINEYQILPELKYARQDAEAVADSLKQNYCFSDDEVMLLTDAKPGLFKPTDRYLIQDHLDKLANQDLDLFVFGFWGHGLFRNGQRYLCPMIVKSDRAERQGLPFDELQELLAKIHAKNTCLILDCCQTVHDRGEAETLTVAEQTSLENIARDIVLRRKDQIPDYKSNVAILNSCKEGQSAYEWDARQHGLFTAHLLDAMKKRSNSVMQIASYISSNIEKTALELGKEQTPFYKLEGDIVLPVETKSTPLVTGDVFISYRHCNADLVAPIEAELKRRGISYFIDRVGVNYSMEYSTVIARAIKACKVLLVMWTKEANDSPDMLQEIVAGLQLKKKVLPYKLGTFDVTEHDALFLQLSPLSRCEAITPTPDSVTELVNRIQQILTGSMPVHERPTFNIPEKSNDAVIPKTIIEDANVTVTPSQNEQIPSNQNKQPGYTSWSSFKLDTTIVKYIGKETKVAIPEGVTKIEDHAFKDCKSFTSVAMPKSLAVIGWGAFEDCSSLTSVILSKGVTEIKSYAFHNCSSLMSVEIPEGVAEIGESAFRGCSSLKSVAIHNTVVKIRSNAFMDCCSLTSVTIPKGVKEIEYGAFSGCSSLSSASIPEGVTDIRCRAFENCNALTSLTIPRSVKNIDGQAFIGCTALRGWQISLTHPYFKSDGVCLLTKNGKALVVCLPSASECQIPAGVTEIGSHAFHGCIFLSSVIIPNSVTIIKSETFRECSSLKSITIPESVTEIEFNAFHGCSSLASVSIPKSVAVIGSYAFYDCISLTSVTIPLGVSKIESHAFSGCSSLTSITIPDREVEICYGAFDDCPKLTICAPEGSKAEEYAKENKIPFQVS